MPVQIPELNLTGFVGFKVVPVAMDVEMMRRTNLIVSTRVETMREAGIEPLPSLIRYAIYGIPDPTIPPSLDRTDFIADCQCIRAAHLIVDGLMRALDHQRYLQRMHRALSGLSSRIGRLENETRSEHGTLLAPSNS